MAMGCKYFGPATGTQPERECLKPPVSASADQLAPASYRGDRGGKWVRERAGAVGRTEIIQGNMVIRGIL